MDDDKEGGRKSYREEEEEVVVVVGREPSRCSEARAVLLSLAQRFDSMTATTTEEENPWRRRSVSLPRSSSSSPKWIESSSAVPLARERTLTFTVINGMIRIRPIKAPQKRPRP